MEQNLNSRDYWNALYKTNETGWDIGYPSPAIKEYAEQLTDKSIDILIPGCGNSYEAAYLLQNDFSSITLIDIAPSLTQVLAEKFKSYSSVNVLTGDFFELEGQYDLILEQTFLSALPPSMRPQYADKMSNLLKPGGKLVGVLFNRQFEDSPPYGGDEEEYRRLFSKQFEIKTLTPCYNSIERRAGSEVFINLTAKKD